MQQQQRRDGQHLQLCKHVFFNMCTCKQKAGCWAPAATYAVSCSDHALGQITRGPTCCTRGHMSLAAFGYEVMQAVVANLAQRTRFAAHLDSIESGQRDSFSAQ